MGSLLAYDEQGWPTHQHLEEKGLVSGRQLGGLEAHLAAHVALI